MLGRVGILATVLALSVLLASPAFAQDSLAERIINDVRNNISNSPSQTTYDEPGDDDTDAGVPPQVAETLCDSIVGNDAIPTFIQAEIAEAFGLGCEPVGSFLDAFLDGTFLGGLFDETFLGGFFD